MREITCERRDEVWSPRIHAKEVMVGGGSTNFMGNGLAETVWVWDENDHPALRDERRYAPGEWPDPKAVESCRHWEYEPHETEW